MKGLVINMKRIALFINSLQKGGSERVMVNLAEFLHHKGYEILLVTQYKKDVEYEISPDIRRIYSEPDQSQLGGGRIHNFLVRFNTLKNIWKDFKPDVVLSFLGKNNLMAIMTTLFLPAKVAVSVRGEPTMEYEGKIMQLTAKFMFRFADGVAMQTKQAAQFFPKAVRKKVEILSNPLNPVFINRRFEGPREDIIVAAGRLDDNKNHAMLIHAFAKIADEYPGMRLVIFGEGENREKLEKLITEKNLSDRVSLPGNVSDIADRICSARIFTLTSNTEGMPNSIMEAMALGIPVISTDCPCGGPAMLIEDSVNGLLVPVGDAYALADAFRKILSDNEFEITLGNNAYESSKKYDPQKVNSQWEKFLNEL